MNADFGTGVEPDTGKYYQQWRLERFFAVFSVDGSIRPDEDLKAIVYSMGGPFPSCIDRIEYAINPILKEVKVYIITNSNYNSEKPR
jgi:hypothetical protein